MFKADNTYSCGLNTRTAKGDQVVSSGVMIETDAEFDFRAIPNESQANYQGGDGNDLTLTIVP